MTKSLLVMKAAIFAFVALLFPILLLAQQVPDESYHYTNAVPAYTGGTGPRVCVDEGHHNFHTLGGGFLAFGRLIESDGFRVTGFAEAFTIERLQDCDVLVIANALSADNEVDWRIPHNSAFTREELEALVGWIRNGGALMLFADHSPFAGAASALGIALGINMLDVYALSLSGIFDTFQFADETLHPHPILHGRQEGEEVDKLATFAGHVFEVTAEWSPIATVGSNMRAYFPLRFTFQEGPIQRSPSFPIAGWKQIATREWDRGRIMVSGEAAMCTAQLYGDDLRPMGMNHPAAKENAQFCLNAIRWLTGVIDP